MHINFEKVFAKPAPSARVRARRQMTIKNAKGELVEVKPGDELEILQSDIGNYDGEDIGVLKSAKEIAVADPSPARPEPAPLPTSWEPLPNCFKEFHQISEDLRTAAEHVQLIEDKRQAVFGGRLGRIGEASGKIFMGRILANPDPRNGNVNTMLTEIDMDDPEIKQMDRFLSSAENDARDYLTRIRESKSIALQKAYLECGTARLKTLEELQGILSDLAATGFAIFRTRLAALGLHIEHERRLFHGSSDYLKFGGHGIPVTHDLRSAGLDETGQPMIYVDQPVVSSAQLMLADKERLLVFTPLLAEARKELAKTQKASLPTGLPA